MIKTITAAELINGRTFDRTIIDIRPAEEYKKGSMDAALNIPEDKLVEYLENPEEADLESGTIGDGKAWEEGVNVGKLLAAIPKDKPVWVLCHTGNKSLYVAELMSDAGFDAGSVEGGYRSFLRLSLSMMVMNEEEVTERTKAIERSIITKYRKSIWRRFTKGVHDYELIKEGDKIAVCISRRKRLDADGEAFTGAAASRQGKIRPCVPCDESGLQRGQLEHHLKQREASRHPDQRV